jgi:hypothetical protein
MKAKHIIKIPLEYRYPDTLIFYGDLLRGTFHLETIFDRVFKSSIEYFIPFDWNDRRTHKYFPLEFKKIVFIKKILFFHQKYLKLIIYLHYI